MQNDKYLQELYANIELDLIRNIASRFDVDEIDGGTLEWHTKKLNELGMLSEENIKVISKYSGKTTAEIKSILKKSGYDNIEESAFKEAYSKGVLNQKPVALMKSEELKNILNTSISNSIDSFNLVNTTALESANEEYLKIVNQVYLETTQGIYDYNTSIRKATNKLAEKGITGATYMRTDGTHIRRSLESAIRMQLLTANNQCMTKMQEQRAKEWGSNLVEVSSHMGARPSHAVWQGKIYMLEGSSDKYPNFYEATGYGTVTGLAGVNCRHTFYPYLEGVSEDTYKHYNLNENKEQYELEQKQRILERKVRIEKKKMVVAENTGDVEMYEKAKAKLKERQKAVKEFVDSHSTLRRDYSRESIGKYTTLSKQDLNIKESASKTMTTRSNTPKDVTKTATKQQNQEKNSESVVKYNKLTANYTGNDSLVRGAFENATIDDDTARIINNIDKVGKVTVSTGVKRGGFSPTANTLKVSNSKDFSTFYHEWGHSIDYLVSYQHAANKNDFTWLSNHIEDARVKTARAIKNSIPDSLGEILTSQRDRIVNSVKETYLSNGKLDELVKNRILKEYGDNFSTASGYMQEYIIKNTMKKELSKLYKKAIDSDADYNKWSCVSDIYDAITSGSAYNSKNLIASHGYSYYNDHSIVGFTTDGKVKKENAEIFANYVEMRLGNYTEQLEYLRNNCPELMEQLDKTYSGIAKILEELK